MRHRARSLLLAATLALLAALIAAPASPAAPGPAWKLTITPFPANFEAGEKGEFFAIATNVGAAPTTSETASVEVTLPAGFTPQKSVLYNADPGSGALFECLPPSGQTITCQTTAPIDPGQTLRASLRFEVAPGLPDQTPEAQFLVSGGGAAQNAVSAPAPVRDEPVPYGFLSGLQAPMVDEDGAPTSSAGAHPYQQSIDFVFPTLRTFSETGSSLFANSGHPRDVSVRFPAGYVADPGATADLCTEAGLTSESCPDSSQVGLAYVTTLLGGEGNSVLGTSPLYNMVPSYGHPAVLAFNAVKVGIFIHILGSVRSESDYAIQADTPDILALGSNPLFGAHIQLWGDPSAAAHDGIRGNCLETSDPTECPVTRKNTSFLTAPTSCSGGPLLTQALTDSWEEPGVFRPATYESADLQGSPVSLSGCDEVPYAPEISARPTTNLADSPSGLDFNLRQPQDEDPSHRAAGQLKDAEVTLPPGMVVNPSGANGRDVCSSSQIGYLSQAEGVHFSKAPATCPDAAKLGTVEVTTPLVVQRDPEHELETDPQTGKPLLEPLKGSVYLAEPFENPFGSLLAVYLAVEDPRLGIVAKLAGRVEPDPDTGRLTTVFEENPQLPLEDVALHLFGGARGSLITPPTCGNHTTTSTLTPWSAPEAPLAHPSSSFATTAAPGGGACPGSEAQLPNSPAFDAGTTNPQAGAYSPFVLKISREDGSQRLTGIDTLLAPGLSGKLAGIAQCPEAQIAQAQARSHPEEGRLERESPSCPLSSQVGTVVVGAGAGPTPYYTQGTAYLAGPYKGAPLSLAIITPAIAGPFDLGTVVTRVALRVEPETAQIHAVSDPLPTILDGIPLDVRSVALKMDRPQFTLNPTSCDPLAITGTATSALGAQAPLSRRFQVGGCSALAFKPKLSLALKGSVKRSSHPRLIATLSAKGGEANVARAQVKLSHAVFLDQAHIRTICTRVQFAADACPPGSVYGKASAITPLLDQPLSGSVYLRSNPAHELPDLVAKLKGPASLPIEIDLVGKTDAVKGALRNTFEAVPDAPVSRFRLELFGGKRGLVEMSDGFCKDRHANVQLEGQNGKAYDTRPVIGGKCPKRGKGKKGGKHKGGRHG
jgi:hypothetical protein